MKNMRKRICGWIKNPCCGWQGWLFRFLKCEEFQPQPPPQFITEKVCDETGLLAHLGCPIVYERSFLEGDEPRFECRRHKRLKKYGRKK